MGARERANLSCCPHLKDLEIFLKKTVNWPVFTGPLERMSEKKTKKKGRKEWTQRESFILK